ncbi:MAG: 50S ribosomal protein L9 [Acidobacteriota bacterium]
MKLILQEPVVDLGEAGDEIDVAAGYGRNYLLPKGLAVIATKANMRLVRERKAKREARAAADLEASRELAGKLSEVSINIRRKVADGDTLYGSVSAVDIAAALEAEGFEIIRDQVKLAHPIKTLGIYDVPLGLPHGIEAIIKLWVVKE